MIVVDSSVWIDHLNGRDGPEVRRLQASLADPRIGIGGGDLVLFDVLAGLPLLTRDRDFERLAEPLGLRLVSTAPS